MTAHTFAYLAGFGCAIAYGIATVLEQIGARREAMAKKFSATFLFKLLHQLPYMLGILLDAVGWLLSLAAVRELPLFLTQSLIASSLVVTSLIDRFFLHTIVSRTEKVAMGMVLLGLILLAVTATPTTSALTNQTFRDFLVIMPGFLAVAGVLLINYDFAKQKATLLTVVAGLAFGGTSLTARAANLSHLGIHTLFEPMVLALITYGIVGMILFSTALQRDSLSRLNSPLFATQVAVPSTLGIFFLGDSIRSGLWFIAGIGLAIVFAGTLIIALSDKDLSKLGKKLHNIL